MPHVSSNTDSEPVAPVAPAVAPSVSVAASVLRVTQQDVARAAGVHNSTVSLALRGSPTISATTRDRVRRIAAAMGYAPDPAVQALVAYRIRLARRTTSAGMAFVTRGASAFSWRSDPGVEACFLGAQERAAELGFTLEHFWAGDSGLSQRRLDQILYHRAIEGVILLSHGGATLAWDELTWTRLCGVAVGPGQVTPHLHRVTIDPSGNLRLALARARRAGYRRIGFVLPRVCDEASDGMWSQAFAAEQTRCAGIRLSSFVLGGAPPEADGARRGGGIDADAAALARWLDRHRPEVVLGWGVWMHPHLALLGLRVPRDLAFVELDRREEDWRAAGVRQNHAAVGAIAAERVAHVLQQNLRGAPSIPTRTLVEGVWCDGETLPPLEPSPALARAAVGDASELMGASSASSDPPSATPVPSREIALG